MLYHAKNGVLPFSGAVMDYIAFGSGTPLILLTGLGDGLKTVKNTALPLALMYRKLAKGHRVYAFSRPEPLSPGCTTREMAAQVRAAMELLHIGRAHVMGVSQGGMIAQHLAADFPEAVGKLILVSTAPCSNDLTAACIPRWTEMVREGRYRELMEDNLRLMYSESYCRRNLWTARITGRLLRPRPQRFLTMAEACLTHDCRERLPLIQADTLILGGEQDRVLGGQASRDMAALIPSAKLVMYPHLGHALYDEAKDFQQTVLQFLEA